MAAAGCAAGGFKQAVAARMAHPLHLNRKLEEVRALNVMFKEDVGGALDSRSIRQVEQDPGGSLQRVAG